MVCAGRGVLASAACRFDDCQHTFKIDLLYFSFPDIAFPITTESHLAKVVHTFKALYPLLAGSDDLVDLLVSEGYTCFESPLVPFVQGYTLVSAVSAPHLERSRLAGFRKHLRRMMENVAALYRNFDVQTALVPNVIQEITALLRVEMFDEAHARFQALRRYVTLYPRMALLVNTFSANFDDTAITHANLRALVRQLNAISFVSSQELAPRHAQASNERSNAVSCWMMRENDVFADLLNGVVSALGTNDTTVLEAAVSVLAALAGPVLLSPHAPSSAPCSTVSSPCGCSPSSRTSSRRSSSATT